MWDLKWLNMNSLSGGQTLAYIILFREADQRTRLDPAGHKNWFGVAPGFSWYLSKFLLFVVLRKADTIVTCTQIISQLKVEPSRRQQQCWNKPCNFSSSYGNNRQLSLEIIEFIVTAAYCPADHSLIFPVSGKWLEGNSFRRSVAISGILRSLALLTSGS